MNTTLNKELKNMPKSEKTQINENIEILTRKSLERGCQFQLIDSREISPLYITEYNQIGDLILFEYQFACEYGRDMWANLFRVLYSGPNFFVFEFRIFGQIEILNRYYKDFKIVNYTKHQR
jgi:hypothetical protein